MLPTPKRFTQRPLVTVSASFNRHLPEMQLAVQELWDEGARVLSPMRPTPFREISGGFLLLDGDRSFTDLSIKSVQDRHLVCIAASDFLWVVCPDGYVGNSTAMEIGVAVASNVPIYSLCAPLLPSVAAYVHVVSSVKLAVLNHRIFDLRSPGS